MPETPDFDQIALALMAFVNDHPRLSDQNMRAVAEQLRLVWNARGAADVTKLERELSALMGSTAAGPYVKNLDRAIRALDR